ncbi:hypothetical protein [Actinoplanes couchii]|uniref:Collagen triple helix repeat protein n=1 Tax=Actinoplanes couchii TaxID=403638 RepID=A0ABQ3XJT9_9ACTN|nr:hypothetical protein [Actinoplanes couchii]MDR6324240.1 hypothetical protein [Actinoplanes couchii]GID58747.1 hypothetical protein Aco03nite_071510 [Actinoplanes couchii]
MAIDGPWVAPEPGGIADPGGGDDDVGTGSRGTGPVEDPPEEWDEEPGDPDGPVTGPVEEPGRTPDDDPGLAGRPAEGSVGEPGEPEGPDRPGEDGITGPVGTGPLWEEPDAGPAGDTGPGGPIDDGMTGPVAGGGRNGTSIAPGRSWPVSSRDPAVITARVGSEASPTRSATIST